MKTSSWILFGIIGTIIFIALSFHILPDHLMIFPKEHLTFSNTFIFQDDIEKITERFNNASFFEKQAIKNESLYGRLMEKKIIFNYEKTNDKSKEQSITIQLEYLKNFEGKYPDEVDLLEDPRLRQRMEKLLGDKYEFLIRNFNVVSPIKIEKDGLIASGFPYHSLEHIDFTIVYDFLDDTMYVKVTEDGESRIYSEKSQNIERFNEIAGYE